MIDQVSKQPQLPKRRAAPPPGRGPFLSPILGRKVCIPILSGLFAINSDRRRAPDPRVVRGNRDWVSDPLKCESHRSSMAGPGLAAALGPFLSRSGHEHLAL
jgi:hypothetical protein